MAKAGYPSGPGAGPKNLDTTTAAGHYGAGGDNNGGGQTTPPGEPASIDISLGGGFLQGTGSIANNVFDDPQHVDGTITFQSSSVEAALDRSKYPYPRYRIPQNQRRRFQIINEKRAILNRPIEILDFNTGDFIMPELDQNNLTFSMSFENTDVIPATSTTFLGSYADVTLGNLRTYSGDIHRMKVYARHQNDQAEDFNRIGDFVVRDKNELIDKTSPTGQAPIGIFYSQSVIDNHWISSSNSITPMSVANNELISAAFLSGSNRGDGEFFDFQTRKYIPLRKAQDYIVNFSSYFIKKPKVQPDGSVIDSAKIELLLSGSIESSQNDLLSLGTISGEGDDSSETLEGRISGSIPNLFNYFRTYSNVAGEASASLVFRVHAGEFHVSNVALRPLTFANFHPDSYNVRLPMPKKAARNQQYDFRVEFYDFNNNKSVATTESTASVFFAGTNDVIDGFDNKIEGAQTWGNSMEAYGVSGNSAYLRSIGYNGFAKTTAGSGERDGGFMMWSGSIGSRITASEAYNGVGLEIVDASATDPSNHRFLQFASNYKNSGNSRFRVQTDEFLLGISSSAANNYISGSNGKLEISSSNFELNGATGNVTLQGIITATAGGTIGGFTIGSSTLSTGTGANFIALDSTNKKLRIGAKASLTDSNTGVHVSTDGIALGASSVFKVTNAGAVTAGNITATGGKIANFTIDGHSLTSTGIEINDSTQTYFISSSNFKVKHDGEISGSDVLFTAGKIANFTIDGHSLATTGVEINDSTQALFISSSTFKVDHTGNVTASNVDLSGKITATTGEIGGWTVGSTLSSTNILLDPSTPKITLGSKATLTDSNAGAYIGTDGIALGASSVFKVEDDGTLTATAGTIGGFSITSTELFSLDSGTPDSSPNNGITIDTTGGSNSKAVIKVFDGTTENAALGNFASGKFGIKAIEGEIGGWTISDTTISSNNLILNSVGLVETSDYVSGLKGFRLSSQNNGFLEVENAKIRGTLRTTVFEKESVNAVGGQLQVGNATTITGSATITATATSIPVENVTGFTGSEIILAKKVGNTGFSTEYMLITSQSRRDKTSDTDFSGSLFVVRGYSGSVPTTHITSSLGDSPSSPTTLEPGQVLVSTGHFNAATTSGSGYIRMNANPNDPTTPYMDIVERTGSKIYEVDLKARLGDLSGLSTGFVGTNPGFGLFTERAFLTKDVTIGTLGSEHILLTDSSLLFKNGAVVKAQLDGNTWTLGGATGTTSDSVVIGAGGVKIYDNSVDYVSITSAGLSVFEGDASNPVAVFGTDATVGLDEAGKSNVFVDSDGNVDIRRGTQVSASFGTTTTIGPTTGQHVSIDSDSFDIKKGSQVSASFGTTTTIGPTTGQHVSIDSDSLDVKVGSTVLSTFGTDMTIGKTSGTNRNVFVDSNGNIDIKRGSQVSASFGTTTTIGPTSGQHVSIDSDSFDIKKGSEVSASFGTTTTIGPTSGDHVLIDNDSVDIKDGSSVLSSFGATTTIGNTATEHVSISSTELKLKDGNGGGTDIDYVTINSSGMQIGDDITISTAGASSLSIGNLANVADIGDTSTGFLVDSSGNVLIKQGAANKNYMQFSGSVIDLQSDTFNLVTTGSGAGEDGGLIINSAQPLIMISGSRGTVKGNSVRLLGDEGVLEVSQSGEGVFDTGRTKTFTTSTIIEPAVFKPGVVSKGYVSSSTQTVQAAPRMDNLAVGNIQAGGLIDTNAIFLDTARSSTAFAMVNDISRNNAATNPDGVAKPTASFAVNHTVNYTANTQNSNCHPAFTFNADYFTELAESGTNNTLGWVQNSVPSGSNIFTISATARDVDNTDFEDAKFNILGLESNTSGLHLNRQNEYTFLQAKHSGSIRLQIQHDGDVISKGNITAFGTSFLTVSDEREKFDVHTISESLDRILDLRPTKFTWIETSKDDVGFIAQEVEEVIPEVVETSRGFINTGDDKERKTIAYPKLVPYLVDTIQVLTKRIEELEKKVK